MSRFCSNLGFALLSLVFATAFFSRFRILKTALFSNIGLSRDVQKAATHIACKAVDTDIVAGKSPISVAAAAIYMASQVRSSSTRLQMIIVRNIENDQII